MAGPARDRAGYQPPALGTWLRTYREQVFLFTRVFAVSWTALDAVAGKPWLPPLPAII